MIDSGNFFVQLIKKSEADGKGFVASPEQFLLTNQVPGNMLKHMARRWPKNITENIDALDDLATNNRIAISAESTPPDIDRSVYPNWPTEVVFIFWANNSYTTAGARRKYNIVYVEPAASRGFQNKKAIINNGLYTFTYTGLFSTDHNLYSSTTNVTSSPGTTWSNLNVEKVSEPALPTGAPDWMKGTAWALNYEEQV